MHRTGEWYVQIVDGRFVLFRDHRVKPGTTYMERFRLQGKLVQFDTPQYALRAAAHLNNMPTGARL